MQHNSNVETLNSIAFIDLNPSNKNIHWTYVIRIFPSIWYLAPVYVLSGTMSKYTCIEKMCEAKQILVKLALIER